MADKPTAVTITASYGLTVPGEAEYTSQNVTLGVSIEIPAEGNLDVVLDQAQKKAVQAVTNTKLAVFSQLGIGFTEAPNGVVQPDFTTLPKRTPSVKGGSKYPPKKSGGYSGGGGGSPRGQVYTGVFVEGFGTVAVEDLRDVKDEMDKPNWPDFKIGDKAFWMTQKNGSPNPDAEAIAEAVHPYLPY